VWLRLNPTICGNLFLQQVCENTTTFGAETLKEEFKERGGYVSSAIIQQLLTLYKI
jgi:hypothetical protein